MPTGPALKVAGLARHLYPKGAGNSLTAPLDRLDLTEKVSELAA